jgi:S1-C subfamily serine protease
VTLRTAYFGFLCVLVLVHFRAGSAGAQDIPERGPIEVVEDALAGAISRAESSVVAIARVRKDVPGEDFRFEFRPDPFGGPSFSSPRPKPTDPDFIPSEFATGVVVDSQGLILTAYHILSENSDYYVTTADRKVFPAWVKAADPRSDLAVLAVDAADLVPISIGDASTVRKGQLVIALGNPYAIARDGQASASWGIVANLARKAPPLPDLNMAAGKSTLHHFGTLIQTDAKLNVGTSGGPLLNFRGEMIGLCISLAALSGYEQSAGYAIPADETFQRALATLKQGQEVEYGFLGITPGSPGSEDAAIGLHGARVDRVWPGTPADRYGLNNGDLITAVNGKSIYDADGLMLEVGRQPVEADVRLSVLRNGRRRDVEVVLTKYHVRGLKIASAPQARWRGITVDYPTALVDPNEWASLETPLASFDDGVIVTTVEENSPAWRAGFRPKHVISHVGSTRVRSPREFYAAAADKSGPVPLRLTAENDQVRSLTVVPGS